MNNKEEWIKPALTILPAGVVEELLFKDQKEQVASDPAELQ